MKNLQIKDITSLYVVIDDVLQKSKQGIGRPSALSDNEMLTILIWCTSVMHTKLLKDVYVFIYLYHRNEFPKLPDYSNFVRHCHRLIPLMCRLLENGLATDAELRFVDSTMLPVCKRVRADVHKTCRGLADWGKNWQGWHYGFKLHASINPDGQFAGIFFTPASSHDAQQLPYLAKGNAKIMVGDGTYGARVMREHLWKTKGVFVLAPPHPKQDKKLLSFWQLVLLEARPKIECVWDYLKEHMHLVSSFPRSVVGYFFHYLRIILAYQCQFFPSTC